MQKSKPKYACLPSKIFEVWIARFCVRHDWWSRLHLTSSMFPVWLNLFHWGKVTHICVGKLTIIGSDNGLSPERRQAIIGINAGIFLIGPLGTNFSENLIEILTFSFTKMWLTVSSAKWRPFCLGLNVLKGVFLPKPPMRPQPVSLQSFPSKSAPGAAMLAIDTSGLFMFTLVESLTSAMSFRIKLAYISKLACYRIRIIHVLPFSWQNDFLIQ